MGSKEDNHCCPYFAVMECADTGEHSHIACRGTTGDILTLSNDEARKRCLGNYAECPSRPRGEDGGLVR